MFSKLYLLLSSGRPPKTTQQQMLQNIDQLSTIDQCDNSQPSGSTHVNQNFSANQYGNSYLNISNQPHYASTNFTPQFTQIQPICYRCRTTIYGNFTNCINCRRSCCHLCTQTNFFSYPITCEYCAM